MLGADVFLDFLFKQWDKVDSLGMCMVHFVI